MALDVFPDDIDVAALLAQLVGHLGRGHDNLVDEDDVFGDRADIEGDADLAQREGVLGLEPGRVADAQPAQRRRALGRRDIGLVQRDLDLGNPRARPLDSYLHDVVKPDQHDDHDGNDDPDQHGSTDQQAFLRGFFHGRLSSSV